ncbi:MAG: glycosyltransferase family 4 protein [Alphaproteobacteria bacterium]|nr:glycosyltransferase family 4 protein [Alphaproteobacteria bacterium]
MTFPIRVASIETVVPSYRYQFLEKLASRKEVDTTCFHGTGRQGYSVAPDERTLPVASRHIVNFYWPRGGARVAWQTGLWEILKGRFDVVIVAEATHNLTTWAIMLLRPIGGYAVILSGHGLRPLHRTSWREPMRLWLRKLLAQMADAMLVYSDRSAAVTAATGIAPEKIFVAPNTLDTQRLILIASETLADAKKCRNSSYAADTRPEPKPFNLLYVGRLYPAKRVDLLLQAARILQDRGRDAHVLIIGDGEQRAELVQLAKDLTNVRFEAAEYDDKRLAHYFAEADLLVLPDAVGLGVIHGFCNSVPILTTQNGRGHGPEVDYVIEGHNGVFAEDLDPTAFVKQIERLMDDPALVRKLKAGALSTAHALSIDLMVDSYVEAARYAHARRSGRLP